MTPSESFINTWWWWEWLQPPLHRAWQGKAWQFLKCQPGAVCVCVCEGERRGGDDNDDEQEEREARREGGQEQKSRLWHKYLIIVSKLLISWPEGNSYCALRPKSCTYNVHKGFLSEISASQGLHNSSYLFTPPFPLLSILVLFLRIIFHFIVLTSMKVTTDMIYSFLLLILMFSKCLSPPFSPKIYLHNWMEVLMKIYKKITIRGCD